MNNVIDFEGVRRNKIIIGLKKFPYDEHTSTEVLMLLSRAQLALLRNDLTLSQEILKLIGKRSRSK